MESEEKQKLIEIKGNVDYEASELLPKQSANSLFHFFKQKEYLFNTIQNLGFIPRFNSEHITYLDIGHESLTYPMVCFCDINMHNLHFHMEDEYSEGKIIKHGYGRYGLALTKEWGIKNGIQCITYVNENSPIRKDFSEAFVSAKKNHIGNIGLDYLVTSMLYLKPISGKMEGDEVDRLFTDEREWRYIPDLSKIDLEPILFSNKKSVIENYNQTLKKHNNTHLKFTKNDIRYIILYSGADLNEFCELLDSIGIAGNEKDEWISKVIFWNQIREDL